MSFKRLSDIDVRGKRVFIRAGPQRFAAGRREFAIPTTPASARRCRASATRSRGGAVMVTSPRAAHRGRVEGGGLAGADREALGRASAMPVARSSATWSTAALECEARPGQGGAARELPVQQGREEGQRGLSAQDGEALTTSTSTTRSAPPIAPRHDARHRDAPVACAGPLLAAELTRSGCALGTMQRPLIAIVAGSKVSTKLTILRARCREGRHAGGRGGIANTFIVAAGGHIGKSLEEPDPAGEPGHPRRVLGKVPIPVDGVG